MQDTSSLHQRSFPGRPSREHVGERNQRILDAARAMFLSRGFCETTLEAIAKRAGTAKKTLYRQYGDKDALFRSVLEEIGSQWARFAQDAASAQGGLRAALETVVRRLTAASVDPEAVALHAAVIETASRFPDMAAAYQEAHDRAIDPIEALIEAAALRGEARLHELSARAVAELLVAGTHTALRRAALAGAPPDLAERERRGAATLEIVLRALAPEMAR